MKDEYDRILEFFAMPPEEKALHLKDVFQDSVAFFDKFKYILEHGSPEEKADMINKAASMKDRLQKETQAICEETGMTEEELREYAQDPENFQEGDWEAMQDAKHNIEEKASDIGSMMHLRPSEEAPSAPPKKSAKKKKPRKGPGRTKWVKS